MDIGNDGIRVEMGEERSHPRFLWREELRWQRGDVITVEGNFFQIEEWGDRQRACSVACQKLRKQENNRLYRERNPGYWKNHYEDHVEPLRKQHPDYQRQWRQRRKVQTKVSPPEMQAERLRKVIGLTGRIHLYLREIQAEFLLKPSLGASLVFQAP